ncbi:ABC transporter ATP-binding protein [Paraburkholderia nodosa]|uniref:ABC transporter ATP-binding protein n=1 Tax=Paraburkholderia nodosa TaxID=392320 RepID=UPI00048137BF|nr:sn-glycerol-3-phosphate ABC transporter ATP-binding protein UgpC [Paraburkholderia nodosa]
MATIVCEGLMKQYDGDQPVLHPLDLHIDEGEFVVLLGPSGCGKSTMLRMIAGLEEISGGSLSIGGTVVNDVPARERNVAMVFQNYALYPHMSVYENIAFGLRRLKTPKAEIDRRVREVAALLNLDALLERKPRAMSGGQQQRAAIARAMIKTPAVFLFDEPLSNLDAKLRAQLRTDIKRLHQRLKTTTVYVTHDQLEAMTLADRVILMRGGHIEQEGTPTELYRYPRTIFGAGFIGTPAMNFLDASVQRTGERLVVSSAAGQWQLRENRFQRLQDGQTIKLAVRPNFVWIPDNGKADGALSLGGAVELVEVLGAEALITVDCSGERITALVPASTVPHTGDHVRLALREHDLHVFDVATGDNVSLGLADEAAAAPLPEPRRHAAPGVGVH